MNVDTAPMDRIGWYNYYVVRFNQCGKEPAAVLAMWFLFLMYADGEIE